MSKFESPKNQLSLHLVQTLFLGLLASLASIVCANASKQWTIESDASGQVCHLRPRDVGGALKATPVRIGDYGSLAQACSAALALNRSGGDRCQYFTEHAQAWCDQTKEDANIALSTNLAHSGVKLPASSIPDALLRGAHIETIDADCAKPKDFPGTFLLRDMTDTSSSGGCTANLVGPRAMLTAGHCLSDNSKARYAAYADRKSENPTYKGLKCTPSDKVDLAICEFANGGAFVSSFFERISIVSPGNIDKKIVIAGFGVADSDAALLGEKAGFFWGWASLERLATQGKSEMVIGKFGAGETKVRESDSGGPALDGCGPGRKIVGIIRGYSNDIATTQSYVIQNSAAIVKAQLNAWAAEPGHFICGLTPNHEIDCPTSTNLACNNSCPDKGLVMRSSTQTPLQRMR